MLYHSVISDDMKNGLGLRVSLWVAGCEHRCPHCHNMGTWDAAIGLPFNLWEEAEFFDLVRQDHIQGVTFTGGDPLHPYNRDTIGRLAHEIKAIPGKDIWLYTGYTLQQDAGKFIFSDDVANLTSFELDWLPSVDILVDGRYEAETRKNDLLKRNDPHWRGSSNQRLIDVAATLKAGHIVEVSL